MSMLDVVENLAHEEGIDLYAAQGTRGTKRVSDARARIAKKLRAAPWNLSLPEIGRCLNRHHTSVLWMLRGGRPGPKGGAARIAGMP